MKKRILFLIIILILVGLFCYTSNLQLVSADSGFDSSYDSGSSDSGGDLSSIIYFSLISLIATATIESSSLLSSYSQQKEYFPLKSIDLITGFDSQAEEPLTSIFLVGIKFFPYLLTLTPEKSVMIGNKFKADALGAVNAGMKTILVNSDVTEDDRDYIKKEKLDITIIEDIGDVITIL